MTSAWNSPNSFVDATPGAPVLGIYRGCTGTTHAGVMAELLAEGTGGTARTTVRSTLTGKVTKVAPILIARLSDLSDDEVFGILTACRCPEVQ